jgi:uncharacterized repeat protein (TIGR01451 family)
MQSRRSTAIPVLVLALAATGAVCRAIAPADTVIRNHAVIRYSTLDDKVFEASSNEVLMIVQPVYGLELIPDGTVAAPGQTLYAIPGGSMVFHYDLTFTGNARDSARIAITFADGDSTFLPRTTGGVTGLTVYNDLDTDGVVDTGDVLVAQWLDDNADGEIQAGEVRQYDLGERYDPDATANLLVSFDVPAATADGTELYFGLDAVSVEDGTKTDTGNIAQALVVDDAVLQITKAADPVATVNTGGTVEYTITAVNVGSQTAGTDSYDVDGGTGNYSGLLVYDPVPVGAEGEPLAVSAVSGTVTGAKSGTVIYADVSPVIGSPADWDWQTNPAALAGDVTVVGFVTDNGTSSYDLDPAETVELLFTVTAPSTEQVFSNRAHVRYENTDGPTVQTVGSNRVYHQVTVAAAGPGVTIADTDATGDYTDEWTPPDDSVADNQTRGEKAGDEVYAGTLVYFVNRVTNTGNVTDSFNITWDDPNNDLPAKWEVSLLKGDHTSPLNDTGTDGIPDTGRLEPGETRDLTVRVKIPADQPALATPIELEITARSTVDNTVSDTTTDIVHAVTAASMDLANHIAPVGTPSEAAIQADGEKAQYVDFPLMVRNTAGTGSGADDTYALGTSSLPEGWLVVFYLDANNNRELDDSELQPVSNTRPVAAGGYEPIIARVFIPAQAAADGDPGDADAGDEPDPYSITFKATSKANGASDEITNRILLAYTDLFELRPDRNGVIAPGGTVLYPHTLRNLGERGNRFYLTITPGQTGWTHLLLDGTDSPQRLPTEDVGGTETYYIDLSAAGEGNDEATFQLRVYAPANTAANSVDLTSIVAEARDFGIAQLETVVDVTRVADGDLVLTKSVTPTGAVAPGDTLTYTTTFFNRGTAALSDVVIFDQNPDHTVFKVDSASVSVPGGTGTVSYSSNGGVSWGATPAGPAGTADPAITNIRVSLDQPLPSGVTGSFVYEVLVSQ